MATTTRNARGKLGERLAAEHLERFGYRVVGRNFRTTSGELDLVAVGGSCLVFCEVKTRVAGGRSGPPTALDAIGPAKRRQVRRMASEWLRRAGAGHRRPLLRFDAIGVTLDATGGLVALDHVEDAF